MNAFITIAEHKSILYSRDKILFDVMSAYTATLPTFTMSYSNHDRVDNSPYLRSLRYLLAVAEEVERDLQKKNFSELLFHSLLLKVSHRELDWLWKPI